MQGLRRPLPEPRNLREIAKQAAKEDFACGRLVCHSARVDATASARTEVLESGPHENVFR